jgi:hypothetical protein
MKNSEKGLLIFLGILVVSFWIGSYILTAAFFGTLTLIGFIVLIQSISSLRWLLERTSKVFDACLFILTIMATASLGLNITASLTIAGIGYTLFYGPYLRENRRRKVKGSTKTNYINNFNTK